MRTKNEGLTRRDETADTSAHAANRYREQYFIEVNVC